MLLKFCGEANNCRGIVSPSARLCKLTRNGMEMSLEDLLSNEEFTKIQELFNANEQFHQDNNWKRAFAVSLVKSDQFSNVIQFCSQAVNTSTAQLGDFFRFCWAYALYRTKQYDQSMEILEKVTSKNDLSVLFLKAQLHYRREERIDCAKTFDILFKLTPELRNNSEVYANYVASLPVGIDSPDENVLLRQAEQLQSYESVYNLGCQLILAGKFLDAEKVLIKALEMSNTILSATGEYSESEIQQETSIIRVQLAYVYFSLGRETNAFEQLEGIEAFYDPSTEFVCKSNVKIAEGLHPFFPSDSQLEALSGSQRKKILLNLCFARRGNSMFMKKFIALFPQEPESFGFQAILSYRDGNMTEALHLMQKAPLSDKLFCLVYFKILIQLQRYDEVKKIFLQNCEKKPFLLALLEAAHKNPQFSELLSSKLAVMDETALLTLANSLFKLKKYSELYELLSLIPSLNSLELQAYKVSSGSHIGKSASLEQFRIPASNYSDLLSMRTAKPKKSHSKNPKPKRESLRIDPERWLPKSKRTTNKKPKKKVAGKQ